MAGGGRILSANSLPVPPSGVSNRLILLVALTVIALILLALPPVHDSLGALLQGAR
jgi:hypothetical protein